MRLADPHFNGPQFVDALADQHRVEPVDIRAHSDVPLHEDREISTKVFAELVQSV